MAAPTFQSVIDLARETLNDPGKVHWTDVECLKYANDGTDELMSLRPDLFVGKFTQAYFTDGAQFALGDALPFDGRYKRALADYIIFRASSKDDEAASNSRAAAALQLFGRIGA